ncbi:MAG: PQQ-binding-like beta-propeller repeat protein [Myxococcota bacterium]
MLRATALRVPATALLLSLASLPSVAATPSSGGTAGTGWVRPEHDSLSPVFGLRRVIRLSEPVGFLNIHPEQWAQPFIGNDGSLVYVATDGGLLAALWINSGKLVFKRTDLGQLGASMAQVGDVLLVGSDADLHGLEGYSGKEQWKTELGGTVGGPITVTGTIAIVPVRPSGYVALNGLTGEIRWRQKRGKAEGISVRGTAGASVDAKNKRVFTGAGDGSVSALSLDTGEVLWTTKLSSGKSDEPFPDVDTRPLLADQGRVLLAASYNGGLAGLDPKTGAVLYKKPEILHLTGLTEVKGSAWVVASLGDGQAIGLDPRDGRVRWRYKLKKGGVPNWPVPLEHGLVAIPSLSGPVAILDASTGRPMQLINPGSGISAMPFVRGKDLALWTNKGHLVLLRLGEGTSVTAVDP